MFYSLVVTVSESTLNCYKKSTFPELDMFLWFAISLCHLLVFVQHLAIGGSNSHKADKMFPGPPSEMAYITGDENRVEKNTGENHKNKVMQSNYPAVTHSCIDRCHVNYLAYEAPYQKRIFSHRAHSPGKGFDCDLCHTNSAVGTETHGKLIVQDEDCLACHHKEKDVEDCRRCHVGIQEYREGNIKGFNAKVPDIMVRDVSCTGCHQLTYDGTAFKPARQKCIECHDSSDSYGKIYDIWKEILHNACMQYEEEETDTTPGNQHTTHHPDTLLVSQLMEATSQILARDIPQLHDAGGKDPAASAQQKIYSPVDLHNRQKFLQFLRSYGMHNIILSHLLLQSIKTE